MTSNDTEETDVCEFCQQASPHNLSYDELYVVGPLDEYGCRSITETPLLKAQIEHLRSKNPGLPRPRDALEARWLFEHSCSGRLKPKRRAELKQELYKVLSKGAYLSISQLSGQVIWGIYSDLRDILNEMIKDGEVKIVGDKPVKYHLTMRQGTRG